MRTATYTLFLEENRLLIGKTDGVTVEVREFEGIALEAAGEVVRGLVEGLRALGYRGEAVTLAIPSGWCLAANVPTEEIPEKGGREALLYRLEERLPLEAEGLVTDFITRDGHALGIAVVTARLQPIVASLEGEGVVVESIVPSALLSLSEAGVDAGGFALGDGTWIDLFLMDAGVPVLWRRVRSDRGALRLQIDLLPHPLPQFSVRDLSEDLCAELQVTGPGPEAERGAESEGTRYVVATRAARKALLGERAPWVEFRRDALASADRHRRLRWAFRVAASLFVLSLLAAILSLHLRAERYALLSTRYKQETSRVFAEVLPGQPLPTSVSRRLESHLRDLQGLQGVDSRQKEEPASALATLASTLEHLPRDIRLSLLELRIEEGAVYLSGRCCSHGDAERISAALNAAGKFRVEAPRSENLKDRGVAFTLSGQPLGKPIPAVSGGKP